MTQREVISPTNMAGEEIVDEAPLDVHDDMEFRLGDIELQNLFSDLLHLGSTYTSKSW